MPLSWFLVSHNPWYFLIGSYIAAVSSSLVMAFVFVCVSVLSPLLMRTPETGFRVHPKLRIFSSQDPS